MEARCFDCLPLSCDREVNAGYAKWVHGCSTADHEGAGVVNFRRRLWNDRVSCWKESERWWTVERERA
jgi:hypothetical protein